MKKKIRLGILFGGKSPEHEISLQSASSIIDHLDRDKFSPLLIGINREGIWYLLKDRDDSEVLPLNFFRAEITPLTEFFALKKKADLIFPALHGPYGEDGTVQGLLEILDMPYIGCGVAASAIGMDKVFMKTLFRERGLPQAEFIFFGRDDYERNSKKIISGIREKIAYPCFVKPANGGSSIGINRVVTQDKLKEALNHAFKYDHKVLVEKEISGREIELSVLGNKNPRVSLPGEIVPGADFYDYQAKYIASDSKLIIPAPLNSAQIKLLQELSLEVYNLLGCRGFARIDFFLSNKGECLINEINTLPGFTRISMFPRLWKYSGISFKKLIERLVKLGFEEYEDKKRRGKKL